MFISLLTSAALAGNVLAWHVSARELQIGPSLQPKVTVVESQPQRKVFGSISFAEGTPWCQGNATFWLVGHQPEDTPHCYDPELDLWTTPGIAMMDLNDELNGFERRIDRHDCTALDVNNDGLKDVVCAVGADKGQGQGYNELYLTQNDGSLQKFLRHGLQKYPTIRARFVETLHNRVDEGAYTHVFLSARGVERTDGEVNWHTMYRLIDGDLYFEEVVGPWNKYAIPSSLAVVDWNQDGREDLIVSHENDRALFIEQEEGGTFKEIMYSQNGRNKNIRSARVADLDLDGIPDLIVTTATFQNKRKVWVPPAVKVFKGIDAPERFDFSRYYFKMVLPFHSPDIEILDINSDGILDIYVVQQDISGDSYCRNPPPRVVKPQPPADWTAPLDKAQDILLVGRGFQSRKKDRFEPVLMDHELPGCGFRAKIFGNEKTMILANGDEGRPGSNAILSW